METALYYRENMSRSIALLLVIFLTATSVLVFSPVNAEPRTIVVPDDYPTINAAIESASDGDTILVRNGTYHENVQVIKAIKLIGEDNQETRIDGNSAEGYWVPLALRHDNAFVSNLNLCNSHVGIQLSTVTNCTVVGNRVVANRFGIESGWNSSGNTIIGNIIASNSEGIEINGGTNNLIIGNEILSNNIGIYLTEQSYDNSIIGNMIDNNRDYGICIRMSWDNIFVNNTVTNTGENAIAVAFANNNTFRHNNFINNTQQYHDGGENVPKDLAPYYVGYTSKNIFEENYWSDYHSGDYDGDGEGDSAYTVYTKNTDLTPLAAPVKLPEITFPSEYAPPAFPPPDSATEIFSSLFIVAASVVAVTVASAGLLVYLRKRKRQAFTG